MKAKFYNRNEVYYDPMNTSVEKRAIRTVFIFYFFFLVWLILTIFYEFYSREDLEWGLCITNQCLQVVSRNFPNVLNLFKESVVALGAVTAVFGVMIGWKTYKLSLENSIMANHNTNMKNFIDFCSVQVNRDTSLSLSRIDLHKLYRVVYPRSRSGVFTDFEIYEKCLLVLIGNIDITNRNYTDAKDTELKFKSNKHQARLIKAFNELGVSLEHRHRSDFTEIEKSLYHFFDSVTVHFTSLNINLTVKEKSYI
ncbi:retron Ec48 family effector membrane protein [Pseudoalteromonas rubra]|uniref:retron Ec48 family effector membrane protein n=1 Tax=Pseudoalteromonas rubra TaxID=43658 RepID=UPI002DC01D86|nr:retron Ec48 family effector membrane protein [Pseudoalteromonas rubra]MEC4089582.1 retron Ec48 family effector membrane protein [Pseudoalteromonas rubra]